MRYKYGLDDRPPLGETLVYGLQWLVVSIPSLLIIGKLIAIMHYPGLADQVMYLQKLMFISAILFIMQVNWGHRLPLVIGPATVILVGIVASQSSDIASIYSSIFIGGVILALVAFSGLFAHLQKLFTPRVVAVILMLIAFTLLPTILKLIIYPGAATGTPAVADITPPAMYNLLFAVLLTLTMLTANNLFKGIWKATVVIWGVILGSAAYLLFFPAMQTAPSGPIELAWLAPFLGNMNLHPTVNPGVLISFLFCFLALSINDLGSIQSVGGMLQAEGMEKRTRNGIGFTGIGNALAGLFGVVGVVNFSLSPGIIAATGCASRYTLIPAAIGLGILAFSPALVAMISAIPELVIGSILLYLMSTQIAAGLGQLAQHGAIKEFNDGLIVGMPLMLAIIIAFLPAEALATFPPLLRPIAGNGFVMGVVLVIVIEHLILRKRSVV